MTTTRIPGAQTKRQASSEAPARARTEPIRRIIAAEGANYFLLLGTTLFLVIFGLVIVLSASFVVAVAAGDSPFIVFVRQGLYAIIGVPLMLVASRMPASFWKRWAWPALIVGACLQLLVFVPGLGVASGGNRNWIQIGGVNAQPSELVKLALVVWIAWILTAKKDLLGDWKHVALPIAPVAGVAIGFVLLGNDLGTAFIMLAIVIGSMFFAGVRLRILALALAGIAVLGLLFSVASPSRSERIMVWMKGCTEHDLANYCWQVTHGTWALASGGLFGVGLGNSKSTWSWLPEAANDFIFAVIGEELGLIGAVVVLLLFVVLAISFIRIIRSSTNDFARIATSGIMIWVIGQAFVNIAVVLGVLPVLGVPLPLISAGGSALISTLLAIGVVLSFARSPERRMPVRAVQGPAERSRLAAAQRVRPQR
ncbi:MAG: putative lipid II flippase FtsW [Rhodoglobus sp.]